MIFAWLDELSSDNQSSKIRMNSENQKSFFSQVTLDSSKINKQSLSTSVLPPLHTGQSSYAIYKHKKSTKNKQRPLPFGSTSNRVTEQLEPKVSSHIVSYEDSRSFAKNTSQNKITSFGTSQCRFKEIKNLSPGVGRYDNENISVIKSSNACWQFSKVKRNLDGQIKKEDYVGPGTYEIGEMCTSLKFREKMAEKYRQQKKKYNDTLVKMLKRDHSEGSVPCFIEQNQQKQMASTQKFQEKKVDRHQENSKIETPITRFALKDNTKKYVTKVQKENISHECQPCSFNKNFTYNFIQKSDNAFSSYIPKAQNNPGPGYYPQSKPPQRSSNESFTFKSSSNRSLFPSPQFPGTRQKAKLSSLL